MLALKLPGSVVEVDAVHAVADISSEHGTTLVILVGDESPILNSSRRTRHITTGPIDPSEARKLAKRLRALIPKASRRRKEQ